MITMLSEILPGMLIPDLYFFHLVSSIRILDPGVKIAMDPGSGFTTLTILLPENRSAIAF
jgi:hypothetical protein